MQSSESENQLVDSIKSKVYDIAKSIVTREGFFEYFYLILPKSKNYLSAFNLANRVHYLMFNQYKYSCYHSFTKQLRKYLKS
jgi:hypothetical protein